MVLNLGSTSYKFKLFQEGKNGGELLAEGGFENIGGEDGEWFVESKKACRKGNGTFSDHMQAFQLSILLLAENKVLTSLEELSAIGYKSVHAGVLSGARIIDDELLTVMETYSPFAPAHNPAYIRLMRQVAKQYLNLLQIGCFETSFHAQIPEKRVTYGVPIWWKKELGIRKFGFHGSSHSYIAWKMQEENPGAKKIISLHLGGSSSVCAIENGKSIASSMGATPQSGVYQNNRVGEFDIFCLPVLMEHYGGDWKEILRVLSSESGLYGVSAVSNDMRRIQEMAKAGDENAALAIDAFVDGLVGYIGMFTAYLKGLDAIVFTGGIGCGSAFIRKRVCEELDFMGIEVEQEKNEKGIQGKISRIDSRVGVYCLKTDEELMIYRQCVKIVENEEERCK